MSYGYGTHRTDATILLMMLNHIASHGGVAKPELCEMFGLSKATLGRIIASARQQWGVEITWRRDNTMPHHGEYSIEDWGVFDRTKIKKYLSSLL